MSRRGKQKRSAEERLEREQCENDAIVAPNNSSASVAYVPLTAAAAAVPVFDIMIPNTWGNASSAEQLAESLLGFVKKKVTKAALNENVRMYFADKDVATLEVVVACLDQSKFQTLQILPMDTFLEHAAGIKFSLVYEMLANKPAGLGALKAAIADFSKETEKGLQANVVQSTQALVLKNASGVGKTFGSLAVPYFLNDPTNLAFFCCCYLGFNSKFPLCISEGDFVKKISSLSEDSLISVLCRRLLLQLDALVCECQKGGRSLEQVVCRDWQFGVALPADGKFAEWLHFPPIQGAENRILELLAELVSKCEAPQLNFLLIIDEGQQFDELVPNCRMS